MHICVTRPQRVEWLIPADNMSVESMHYLCFIHRQRHKMYPFNKTNIKHDNDYIKHETKMTIVWSIDLSMRRCKKTCRHSLFIFEDIFFIGGHIDWKLLHNVRNLPCAWYNIIYESYSETKHTCFSYPFVDICYPLIFNHNAWIKVVPKQWPLESIA